MKMLPLIKGVAMQFITAGTAKAPGRGQVRRDHPCQFYGETTMLALPSYIDSEAWDGFCEMRRTIKKPLTTRAAKMILSELHRLRTAGHCPNAALDQSTIHCWAAVYQPRTVAIETNGTAVVQRTMSYLEEQSQHAIEAKRDRLRRMQ